MIRAGRFYVLHKSRADEVHVYDLADLHLFNRACDRELLESDIVTVRDDPFGLWVGGGDYCDYVGVNDPRFDPDALDPKLLSLADLGRLGRRQVEQVKELFWPIREKCLGLVFGNHEDKYMKRAEQKDLHGWLCAELGVLNLQYSALFDLVLVRTKAAQLPLRVYHETTPQGRRLARSASKACWAVRFFVHHGAGFAQTRGGKVNRLERFMVQHRANVYLAAHVHDKMTLHSVELGADRLCHKAKAFNKFGAIAGGYLRAYEEGPPGYEEPKGYGPTPMGMTKVALWPERHRIEIALGGRVNAAETFEAEEGW